MVNMENLYGIGDFEKIETTEYIVTHNNKK